MIQLQRLEGFYWVARTHGYARAARAFPYPITQPGVHQQVRRLEEELGVKLFDRVGKDKVVPTAAGRALYAFVAPFLERLPEVERTLRDSDFGGILRIHAAALPLRWVLPAWLRKLQTQRSDIEVALAEVKTADLSLLRSGETDLLVDWVEQVPEDIDAVVVAQVRGYLVLPASHKAARRAQVSVADLAGESFIRYGADERLRRLQLRILEGEKVSVRHTHAADSVDTILGFVAAGLGFSLVPSLEPKGPHFQGVSAFPLAGESAQAFPIYALWRKSAGANPLVQAALEVAPRISGSGSHRPAASRG